MDTLFNLYDTIVACKKCILRETCKNVVVGCGNIKSEIIIFGEAPGQYEDELKTPFVGPAGSILDKALAEINYTRDMVYITNIVKCRPPNNRKPQSREIKACSENTQLIINEIKPKLIVAAGEVACTYFLGHKNVAYSKSVGKLFKLDNYYVYVVRHPAYALHNRSPEVRAEVIELIKRIPEVLKFIHRRENV